MKKILVLVLLVCLFGACDFFNNPIDPDFLRRIDAEIAWANADRLEVTIAHLTEWGTSNPPQGL